MASRGIFSGMESLEDETVFLDFVKNIKGHRLDRKKLYYGLFVVIWLIVIAGKI